MGWSRPMEVALGDCVLRLDGTVVEVLFSSGSHERRHVSFLAVAVPAQSRHRASETRHTGRGSVRAMNEHPSHEEVEARFRALLDAHGLPQPDAVDYRPEGVAFLWFAAKVAVLVDFDDPPPADPAAALGFEWQEVG